MKTNLSQELHDAVQKASAAAGGISAADVNGIIRSYAGAFKVQQGRIIDSKGTETEPFASVIYLSEEAVGAAAIPVEKVAAVIDFHQKIDLAGFRAAYERLRKMKSLENDTTGKPGHDIGIPFGVLFVVESDLTLEDMNNELEALCQKTPSEHWPDVVVLSSKGLINYAAQFPGENPGDYFLSAARFVENSVPPFYVLRVIRPAGAYTFNKVMALLIARLVIFSSDSKMLNYNELLNGVPEHSIVYAGYQYNLKGDLLPVPAESHNDRYLPPLPLRIEDSRGEVLGTVQFQPWQDGGIIIVRGKFPIDILLVFLKVAVPGIDLGKAAYVKRPESQISYVLPITLKQFNEMLKVFQQRSSGMHVRKDPGKFIIQKISDEGSSSPFVARLMLGVIKTRDLAFSDQPSRERFDILYAPVLSGLTSVRASMQEITGIWAEHVRKVSSGEIIEHSGRGIHVNESIDRELKKEIESFLNTSVRVLKNGMQTLTKELQIDIGFLFKKDSAFNTGIAAFQARDPILAAYVQQVRNLWSSELFKVRNDGLEHGTWELPRVEYKIVGRGIVAEEPAVNGRPVTQFVAHIFDRLTCFVEEVSTHCLQQRMHTGLTVTEIALPNRVKDLPERFRATVAVAGLPPWSLTYHASTFEEV